MEVEKTLILPNSTFSGKKTTKDLRYGGQRKKINKYVHITIQNEMVQIMALRVLREVAESIQDVNFHSIM